MKRVIYPGTFDPITNGHIDIIQRACRIFDDVTVAVAESTGKNTLFTSQERLVMVKKTLKQLHINAKATIFDGLLVDFVRKYNATVIVRGLRAVSDFEVEFQMALMNRKLDEEVETLFLMPKDTYSYLSSSIIKQIARLNGSVKAFVPKHVERELRVKYGFRK
jgi:pantetheine-phosphate adenylyltransferase